MNIGEPFFSFLQHTHNEAENINPPNAASKSNPVATAMATMYYICH